MANKKQELTPIEQWKAMSGQIAKFRHSRNRLYKSLLNVLPTPDDNMADPEIMKIVDVWKRALDLMNFLGGSCRTKQKNGKMKPTPQKGRKWMISQHWLTTVCDPRFTKGAANTTYSPYYHVNDKITVPNRFGELRSLSYDAERDERVPWYKRVVPDADYLAKGAWDFGDAWNDNGDLVKTDKNGNPILAGWSKLVADRITGIVDKYANGNKTRNRVQAFLVFHTRDMELDEIDGVTRHKPVHYHAYVQVPNSVSRLQMMVLMGFNFEFFINTFEWIKSQDHQIERIAYFINSLKGSASNYELVQNKSQALKYLIHQSRNSRKSDKATYRPSEVLSWLPEQAGDYQSVAGVYDDTPLNAGYAEVVKNLHSSVNKENGTLAMVGRTEQDNRRFTYKQLEQIRECKTDNAIFTTFMDWVHAGVLDIGDFNDLLMGALNQETYDLKSGDNSRGSLFSRYKTAKATYIDTRIKHNRLHKEAIFVTSTTGGAGKSRLAKAMASYFDLGREPFTAAGKETDKTFDPFQGYAGQRSIVVDEIEGNWFTYSEIKNLLDPYAASTMSSRYDNVSLWNVRHVFLTQVYIDGVGHFIKDVLRYSPGITSHNYLKSQIDDNGNKTYIFKTDDTSRQLYLADLSQLARRLKYTINLTKTASGQTVIEVSVINVMNFSDQDFNRMSEVGYVHTANSTHTFNLLIDDNLSDERMMWVTERVVNMLKQLQSDVKATFEKYGSNAILNEVDAKYQITDTDLGTQNFGSPFNNMFVGGLRGSL